MVRHKKLNAKGKPSNTMPLMILILSLLVVSMGFYYHSIYSHQMRVNSVFAMVKKLTDEVSEARIQGKNWKRSDWESRLSNTRNTKTYTFSERGVVMLQFNRNMKALSNRWIFFVPAVRKAGTSFEYLNLSNTMVDTTLPMFWICGTPQHEGVSVEELPEDCKTILGPEYHPPQ